jgi:hypothetical protein
MNCKKCGCEINDQMETCPGCMASLRFDPAPCSAFEAWITKEDDRQDWEGMTPTEQMRLAWNAAVTAAAKTCKDYAHSGQNVYRRQVSYACQRRIEELRETPNNDSAPSR